MNVRLNLSVLLLAISAAAPFFLHSNASAHVINDSRKVSIDDNVDADLLDCLQNQYGGIGCRLMLTNKTNVRVRSAPLCVIGSRLTLPTLHQQKVTIIQTTEIRAQYAKRECLAVDFDSQESTLVTYSIGTSTLPRVSKGAIFPELKIMIGSEAKYFSNIPNAPYVP